MELVYLGGLITVSVVFVLFLILDRKTLAIKLKWALQKDRGSYGVIKIIPAGGRARPYFKKLEDVITVENKTYVYTPDMPRIIEDGIPTFYFKEKDTSPIDVENGGSTQGKSPTDFFKIIVFAKELGARESLKTLDLLVKLVVITLIVSVIAVGLSVQASGFLTPQ